MGEPKFSSAACILQLTVSPEWAHNGGRDDLIAAIEKLFDTNGKSQVGPGGAVLQGLFISVQRGRELDTYFDNMRKEFPLRPEPLELFVYEAGSSEPVAVYQQDPDSAEEDTNGA